MSERARHKTAAEQEEGGIDADIREKAIRAYEEPFGEEFDSAPIADIIDSIARAIQAERDNLKASWDAGYLAGFEASGEGWNGEYPFEGRNPEDNPHWVRTRDESRPPHPSLPEQGEQNT